MAIYNYIRRYIMTYCDILGYIVMSDNIWSHGVIYGDVSVHVVIYEGIR